MDMKAGSYDTNHYLHGRDGQDDKMILMMFLMGIIGEYKSAKRP